MKHSARLFWMATALAAAGMVTVAHAAKSTPQARKAAVEKIAKNHHSFNQPRTMAEADSTQVRLADGTVALAVPEELWNHLSAETDAQGNVRVRESDGTVAATTQSEGLSNE